MNYIKLFNNCGGRGLAHRKFGDIHIFSVNTREWAGIDFSNKRYGICVENKKSGEKLYSLTLNKYRFESIDKLREFVGNLSREDLPLMIEELTAVNNHFNEELKNKVETEAEMFDNALKDNNIDFVAFHKLNDLYKKLPRHIRQYYKVKNHLSKV